MKKILIGLLFLLPFACESQSSSLNFLGKNGERVVTVFDDVWGWWRADTYSGSPGSYVFTDKSTNGRHMSQAAGTLTAGTAANGQAMFTGNSTARLTSSGTLVSWPVTIITIGKRANGATAGFFGHTGATGYNTMWYGYEGSNQNSIYANNRTNNVTTEYGADACYVARVGHGSRVAIVNGLILSDMTLSTAVISSATTTTLGTEYRGLNMDWYETLVWNRTLSISELDEVHTYVNTRYGMSIPLWSSYTVVKQVAFGGQSNSDGRGDRGASDVNIPVAYRTSLSNVFVWNFATGAYPNMDLSSNIVFNASYIGQELTGGKDYADLVAENIYVQKAALGSTSMSYSASGNNGYWTESHSGTSQSDGRSQYANTMTQHWKGLRIHQQNSRKPDLKAWVFYQGEDDATDLTWSGNWSSLAQSMFTNARAEFGLGTTPIYLVRIHTSIDGTQHPYKATVRTQQAACAAAIISCTLVSVDSYGLRDSAHLDVAGQLALGTALSLLF